MYHLPVTTEAGPRLLCDVTFLGASGVPPGKV